MSGNRGASSAEDRYGRSSLVAEIVGYLYAQPRQLELLLSTPVSTARGPELQLGYVRVQMRQTRELAIVRACDANRSAAEPLFASYAQQRRLEADLRQRQDRVPPATGRAFDDRMNGAFVFLPDPDRNMEIPFILVAVPTELGAGALEVTWVARVQQRPLSPDDSHQLNRAFEMIGIRGEWYPG